tara:strand:+ start:394 stop:573 length:180 start_codon:yes stop_codon:yes gene_type:complete
MISEELPTIGDVDRILHFRYIKRQVKLITVGPTWINTGRWVPATPENIIKLNEVQVCDG